MNKKIFGDISSLKSSQIKRIEKIYNRKINPQEIISHELSGYICKLSKEINKQIGLLINRKGKIVFVIVGTTKEIVIPRLSEYRVDPGRLRGLRCIHTHLKGEPLTKDDLTDLAILRLDLIAAVEVLTSGSPGKVYISHIYEGSDPQKPWVIVKPTHLSHIDLDCKTLIHSLEKDISQNYSLKKVSKNSLAILINVSTSPKWEAEESLEELKELAKTDNIETLDSMIFRPHHLKNKNLIGHGQLKKIVLNALSKGADTLLFNQDISPTQNREINSFTDLNIVDRTQLILNIFNNRALSREGKTKVELARLKYFLPLISLKDDALSRIRGGIGLRGPGETKMEVGRRNIQDRISMLEKQLNSLSKRRYLKKKSRLKSGLKQISIVGYTNAGKTTLLNALTNANGYVEDKLFATLDPVNRQLYLPNGEKTILSDTVGFIRDLPSGLLDSFRSTLEEINDASLLIHLVDISSKSFENDINVVEDIICQLKLNNISKLIVFNKADKMGNEIVSGICKRYSGIPISAKNKYNIQELLVSINNIISEGVLAA